MSEVKKEMASAKESPSVKQLEINQIISSPEKEYIFFVEGKDDIPCYRYWFRQIEQDLSERAELINLNNKDKVLDFFEKYIEQGKDRKGVSDKIYAIIDHDFDGYKGHPKHDKIYLNSNVYSIENIICSENTLKEIIKSKFFCNNQNDLSKIIEDYKKHLCKFISEVKDINRDIYIAKKANKEIKINDMSLSFDGDIVIKKKNEIYECNDFSKISEADKEKFSNDFENLDPEKQYRGKFLFEFFKKWLVFFSNNDGLPSLKICNFTYGNNYNGIILKEGNDEHKKLISEKKVINNINQWKLDTYCMYSLPHDSLKSFISEIMTKSKPSR